VRCPPRILKNSRCVVSGADGSAADPTPTRRFAMSSPRILAVGTAVPAPSFTQDELPRWAPRRSAPASITVGSTSPSKSSSRFDDGRKE